MPMHRSCTTKRRFERAAQVALLAGLLGCADAQGEGEAVSAGSAYYLAQPQAVLDAASGLLQRQGYQVTSVDATFLELQGKKETVADRSDGSLAKGTLVSEEVVVDAAAEGERTKLVALFTISWRRPTGERRTWVPESALSKRLRNRFYASLHGELGDANAGAR